MKKFILVMPLMAISLLANCNKGGGGGGEDKVQFMLSSDQPTTVEGKVAKVSVDWKPTDHAIKFDSFTFTTEQSKVDKVTFDKESEARPMLVTIAFDDYITEDINGTLSFAYEDVTAKTKNESSIEVTINKPEPTKKWYEYENWWNYCSNDNPISEATTEDIGKEVTVTIYDKVHKIRLIDVEHKEPKEKVAQAHCTFEFANVITNANGAVTTQWNNKKDEEGNVNNYNFPNSTLNDLLNNTKQDNCILKAFPTGLQGVIKEVNKKVGLDSSYSTDKSYSTKLFPLAHDEMADHESHVTDGEGTKYQYYIDHPNPVDRTKGEAGIETVGVAYWFRSPGTNDSNYAWYVNGFGDLYRYFHVDTLAFAVAPAFCI